MSSSEEEKYVTCVKRPRRRKLNDVQENTFEKVNLYSKRVMPAIKKVDYAIMKLNNEFHKKNLDEPTITIKPVVEPDEEQSSDDDVVICEDSPIKQVPVTPPPERKENNSSNNSKVERKKRKLLKNVANVLQKVKQDELLQQSFDGDRADISIDETFFIVKIRFHSSVHKYPLKKESQFNEIFEKLAADVKIDKDRLLLTLQDVRIYPNDTPETLDLSVVDFIDAVVMDEGVLQQSKQNSDNARNLIKLHFQSKFQKHKQTLTINKFLPFSETMKVYATSIGHEVDQLCFLFDGDRMDGSLSAEQLEIEDDYCIDVAQIKRK